jgi:hypothetical protein
METKPVHDQKKEKANRKNVLLNVKSALMYLHFFLGLCPSHSLPQLEGILREDKPLVCVKVFPDLSTFSSILGLPSVPAIVLLPSPQRQDFTVLEIAMCIFPKRTGQCHSDGVCVFSSVL